MNDDKMYNNLLEALKPMITRWGRDEMVVMCRSAIVQLSGKSKYVIVDSTETTPEFKQEGHNSVYDRKADYPQQLELFDEEK